MWEIERPEAVKPVKALPISRRFYSPEKPPRKRTDGLFTRAKDECSPRYLVSIQSSNRPVEKMGKFSNGWLCFEIVIVSEAPPMATAVSCVA